MTVAIAMGGSTNVVLHSVEIARAAGIDLWQDVLSQDEFNQLARRLPVLVNMRPFGDFSMVDVDDKGGLQVIVQELLDAGFLDGDALTCTGETLAEQLRRLAPPPPDRGRDLPGRRTLQGHRRAAPAARQPRSRWRGHPQGGRRRRGREGRRLHRPRPRVQRRALPHRGARPASGQLRGQRHGGDPLRGAAGRTRDARAARPDFADHRAVPPAAHHDRADDRRALLGGIGRPGHRPRRARSHPRGADRARRGRRHHCGRPEHRPPRLQCSSTTPTCSKDEPRRGERPPRATAASTRTRCR